MLPTALLHNYHANCVMSLVYWTVTMTTVSDISQTHDTTSIEQWNYEEQLPDDFVNMNNERIAITIELQLTMTRRVYITIVNNSLWMESVQSTTHRSRDVTADEWRHISNLFVLPWRSASSPWQPISCHHVPSFPSCNIPTGSRRLIRRCWESAWNSGQYHHWPHRIP